MLFTAQLVLQFYNFTLLSGNHYSLGVRATNVPMKKPSSFSSHLLFSFCNVTHN